VTAFERALAVDPGDARLRCETGYAAYRAGNVALADEYIAEAQRALPDASATPAPLRVPVAMCLYNAGLVHEARGRRDAARAAYAASIALRPNDTVQQHLDAVGGAPQGVTVTAFDGLDDAAIDARLLSSECDSYGSPTDATNCSPGHHEIDGDVFDLASEAGDAVTGAPASPPFAARIVWLARRSDSEGNQGVNANHGWLVLRDGAHALASVVSASDATGVWDCDAAITRFEWSDVIPGGTPELVVEATSCGGDVGMCAEEGDDQRSLIVCAASPMRCAQVSLQSEAHGATYDQCDGGQYGGPVADFHSGYRLDSTLAGGNLTLSPTFGSAPNPALVGSHPLTELLDRPDLRWTPAP
jgi:hypothetical protein